MNTITITHESVEITCYATHYRVYNAAGDPKSFKRLRHAKAFINTALAA